MRVEVFVRRIVGRQLARRHLDVAEDRRQQIVEIVRDAAGEPADAFHLLRLQELRFEALPFGDVLHDAEHARGLAALVAEDLRLRRDPSRVRAVRIGAELDVERQRQIDRVIDRFEQRRTIFGMHEIEQIVERAAERSGREIEHAIRVAAPAHGVRGEVPVPRADLAAVERHAEALFAVTQRLLRFLARGDVEHRADQSDRLAIRVVDDVAAIVDVGVGAIRAQEAIFVGPEVSARNVERDARRDALAIVGMDVALPPFGLARRLVGGIAEERLQAFVPPHQIGGEVPVADRVVGGAAEHAEALFALAQRFGGFLQLGDVDARAGEAGERAALVEARAAVVDHPAIFAVVAAHAVLQAERLVRVERAPVGLQAVLAIVIVQDRSPSPRAARVFGKAGDVAPGTVEVDGLAVRFGHPDGDGSVDRSACAGALRWP